MRVIIFAAVLVALATAIPHPVRSVHAVQEPNDVKCALCKELVTIAEHAITTNSSEASVKKVIEDVCNVLEKPVPAIAPVCEYAEENIDQLIKLLLSEATPEEICEEFKQCTGNMNLHIDSTKLDKCTTCEALATVVETALKQNATEQKIETLVNTTCGVIGKYLPAAKAECELVAANIPQIIDLLTSQYTPKEICAQLGVCSSTSAPAPAVTEPLMQAFDFCDTCKTLVGVVKQQLANNATVAEIKTVITQACSIAEQFLPQVKSECDMIENNLDSIIDYIVNDVTPEEACTLVGVCTGKAVPKIAEALMAKHIL